MRTPAKFYLATAAAVCGLWSPVSASAQTAGDGASSDEIIVTARRAEENIQDVPLSVTALTAETLRSENITRASDLQRIAPSLTVNNTLRGSGYPAYAIRGQRSAYTPTPLSDAAIGLYFGEFTMSAGLGSNSSLFDLSSVQVLRGPQGTLFGRNTTGGAIIITPQAPTEEFEGYVQGTAGDFGLQDFEGVVNMPLGEFAALRIGAKITDRDGYTTNVLTGQETDNLDSESYRASFRLTPTDSFETTTIGTYVSDNSNHAYKLYRVDPQGYLVTLIGNAGPVLGPPLAGYASGVSLAELATTQALGDYEYRSPRELVSLGRAWSVQNITTIDLTSNLTFKNIAGYSETRAASQLDWDGSAVEIFSTDQSRTASNFYSEEAQISGDFGNFDFVAGLYYFKSDDSERAITNILGLFAPLVPPVFPNYAVTQFESTSTSYAGYVHGNWDLGSMIDGVSLSGGIRYTRDERTVLWYNIAGAGTPPAYACSATAGGPVPNDGRFPQCELSDETSFEEPTWDISLNYEATPDLLLYVAHRHGYRAGGFNSAPQTTVPSEFNPETISDIEIGFKSEFNLGAMPARFNAAGFNAWYDDIQRQVGRVLPNGSINQVMLNAASATILGAEAELTLDLTPSLRFNLGYAYTKPEYDEFIDLYPAGNLPGSPILEVDVSDSRFAFIPENQYNVSLEWTLPVPAQFGQVSARLSVSGRSGFETQEINTSNCGPDGFYGSCRFAGGTLDGYAVGNFRADWRGIGGSSVDAALFVTNITDELYFPDSVNALSLGFQSVGLGPPRMVGVELRVPFSTAGE